MSVLQGTGRGRAPSGSSSHRNAMEAALYRMFPSPRHCQSHMIQATEPSGGFHGPHPQQAWHSTGLCAPPQAQPQGTSDSQHPSAVPSLGPSSACPGSRHQVPAGSDTRLPVRRVSSGKPPLSPLNHRQRAARHAVVVRSAPRSQVVPMPRV